MTAPAPSSCRIAIACGGTGGHLFPGLAVAQQLQRSGVAVTLLVSPKEVDQQALALASRLDVVTLPAVGLSRGGELAFLRGFARSYRTAKAAFKAGPPQAALAMGGFTSAPPLLAARSLGARIFLHESNSVPGRANRWLSWLVHRAFVGFPEAGRRLHTKRVTVTGTPVRAELRSRDAAASRAALGLDPARPVLLVMGGSQGASAINALICRTLPLAAERFASWQWFHLAGTADAGSVRRAYQDAGLTAQVHAFFGAMELALSAATAAVSRAGASSLAELAATRLPSVLIPYPTATDNHQLSNARALERTGAARVLEQKEATPESLAGLLGELVEKSPLAAAMREALGCWDRPGAASEIARTIMEGTTAGSAMSTLAAATSISTLFLL